MGTIFNASLPGLLRTVRENPYQYLPIGFQGWFVGRNVL